MCSPNPTLVSSVTIQDDGIGSLFDDIYNRNSSKEYVVRALFKQTTIIEFKDMAENSMKAVSGPYFEFG